jgi:hypothetical protein
LQPQLLLLVFIEACMVVDATWGWGREELGDYVQDVDVRLRQQEGKKAGTMSCRKAKTGKHDTQMLLRIL